MVCLLQLSPDENEPTLTSWPTSSIGLPRASERRFRFSASQGVKLYAPWAQASLRATASSWPKTGICVIPLELVQGWKDARGRGRAVPLLQPEAGAGASLLQRSADGVGRRKEPDVLAAPPAPRSVSHVAARAKRRGWVPLIQVSPITACRTWLRPGQALP